MVPVENLDDISVSVAEDKQAAGEQVQAQLLLHDDGEAVDRFAHIGDAQGNIDLYIILMAGQHQSDSRLTISWLSILSEKPEPISIRNLSFCRLKVREFADDSVCSGTGIKLTDFVWSFSNFVFQ